MGTGGKSWAAGAVLVAWLAAGCGGAPVPPPAAEQAGPVELTAGRQLDPPAAAGALAPNLLLVGERLYASWLEPAELGGGPGHRLQVAWLDGDEWSPPRTVAEGDNFFANWADIPALAAGADGSLVVHWLAKTAEPVYAYSIFLARSLDGGASWSPLGRLNDDDTATEHGFVSYAVDRDGLRAFWLDGREMEAGGAMTLRTALVGDTVGEREVLDERVCECCSTDAVTTAAGPLVVYRDRSAEEVRDVAVVRRTGDGWSEPALPFDDGWTIAGCPVNGPEAAAADGTVATAWFTGAGETPRVQVAFSTDAGASFGPPRAIDSYKPLGRVDLVLDGAGGAVVSWLASPGDAGSVRLRRVLADGRMGEMLAVAATGASRKSGFPRLVRSDGTLFLAWVDTLPEDGQRIRLRAVPLSAVPVPT